MPWTDVSELEAKPYTHLDAQRDLALNTSLTISEAASVFHYLPPQIQANPRPAMEHLRHLFGDVSVPTRAGALGALLKLAQDV